MKSLKNIMLFALVSSIISCSVTKKNSRLYQKAVTNEAVFTRIGATWATLNPCPPSVPIYIPGKSDTITTIIHANNDSLFNIIDSLLDKSCPTLNLDSLKTAIKKECKPVYIYHDIIRVDTLYKPDARQLKIEQDALTYSQGQITQLQADKSSLKKENTSKTWWMIGISLIALLIIGILTFLLIKRL